MSTDYLAKATLAHGRITAEAPVNLGGASFAGTISIGAFSYFNYGCEVHDAEIGRYCSIAQRVIIAPGEHAIQFLSTHPFVGDPSGASVGMPGNDDYVRIAGSRISRANAPRRAALVRIGHDVWIGARATILQGVTIGHGAIVAAGAVVTKDVAPYRIVGGVPAAPIRWRFGRLVRRRLLRLEWWNYDLSCLGEVRDYSDLKAMIARLGAMKAAGTLTPFVPKTSVRTV